MIRTSGKSVPRQSTVASISRLPPNSIKALLNPIREDLPPASTIPVTFRLRPLLPLALPGRRDRSPLIFLSPRPIRREVPPGFPLTRPPPFPPLPSRRSPPHQGYPRRRGFGTKSLQPPGQSVPLPPSPLQASCHRPAFRRLFPPGR